MLDRSRPVPSDPHRLPQVALGACAHGAAVVAAAPFAPGEAVLSFEGPACAAPSRFTVQVGADLHVAPDDALWAYVNHSCDPSCVIAFEPSGAGPARLVARRAIARGEQITFNYLTTEWELAAPFECTCGAPACAGTVRGFAHLDRAARAALASWLAPHLASRLDDGAR